MNNRSTVIEDERIVAVAHIEARDTAQFLAEPRSGDGEIAVPAARSL